MQMKQMSSTPVSRGLRLLGLMTFLPLLALTEDTILCVDIPSICDDEEVPYVDPNNHTVCGGNKVRFPNPDVCNCGLTCIGTIEEDESCMGSSTMIIPDEICDYQLDCISKEPGGGNAKCILNPDKECIGKAIEYDAANLVGDVGPGQYRPNCNDDGTYAGRQCSPGSTCYCVDEKNRRLFGETTNALWSEMDCACASYWQETESRGIQDGMRCLKNGNFDPLFCLGDLCYCYDHAKNYIDGPYHILTIINLDCYDSAIHNPDYFNICTKHQREYDFIRANTSDIIVEESPRPNCTHDGYYGPIRHIGPNAVCVDPYGDIIEDFQAPLYQRDSITCNCARRRYVMEESGLGPSKPRCCSNGEYHPVQTRGLVAYCVDVNGNQFGKETPITNIEGLPCNSTCPDIDPLTLLF